ncbi:homoserine dehydrogenase [Nocardia rhizosphaerae]|uniref:homoserine dehydrogenase n=1 Tax=Nocardia rhizosphaerae TaxID=1691571 RepID=A0ABV8LBC6_9NOCA
MTNQLFRSPRPALRVAVLGAEGLGAEVTRILRDTSDDLCERAGAELIVVPSSAQAELVVDTTGDPAAVLGALEAGASVVTADTVLVAEHGHRLAAAAEHCGGDLFFEAAVAGGVPVVRPLTQSLSGDRVERVLAVLPTADAAAQAAILATLAFHTRVEVGDVHCAEPAQVTADDLAATAALGLCLRTLTVCTRVGERPEAGGKEQISVRVHPALLPATDPIAQMEPPFSAVAIDATGAGRLMFSGAPTIPATAAALLGDLVTAARNRVNGGRAPRASYYAQLPIAPLGDTPTRYYLNLLVTDHAGALSRVAEIFAAGNVSIARVRQERHGPDAHLIVLTHQSPESALTDTIDALTEAPAVRAVTTRLRVEGTHD